MSNENPTSPPLALPVGVTRLSDLGTLYTLKQTATRLGVSVKTVRRMVDKKDFPGAHMVAMPNGKGTQWVVPYSEVVRIEVTTEASKEPDHHAEEMATLRERVAKLEGDLAIQQTLATERGHALEQLHLTVRLALSAGKEPDTKRGLFRRKSRP